MSASQLAVEAQTYQGVHKASAGYKLLASMGWKEGEGLGAQGQGIAEHIKVKKKTDAMGVGSEKAIREKEDWLLHMSDFDKMFSALKEVKASNGVSELDEHKPKCKGDSKKMKKKRKASKADSEGTAGKGVEKKQKKKKQYDASSADDEVEEGSSKVATKKKAVSHVGRFRKREAAKSVSNYSSLDLAAILGSAASSKTPSSKEAEPARESEEGCESEEEPGMEPEDESEKWWANRFTRAGTLQKPKKSLSSNATFSQQKKVAIKVHNFSEEDQTNLWSRAHEGASKGRKGLGDAHVQKVGGEKVGQGQKIVFSSEGESAHEVSDAEEAAREKMKVQSAEVNGFSSVKNGISAGNDEEDRTVGKLKTKANGKKKVLPCAGDKASAKLQKLALKKLKANGGELKFRRLCKLVMAGLASSKLEKGSCKEKLKEILGNSKKVEIVGKLVRVR